MTDTEVLRRWAEAAGVGGDELERMSQERYGVSADRLTREQSEAIGKELPDVTLGDVLRVAAKMQGVEPGAGSGGD